MANRQFPRYKSLIPQTALLLPFLVVFTVCLTNIAHAQNAKGDTSYLDHFDEKSFVDLNSTDSTNTPPLGTKITSTNWQQYRQFLPIGIQAFLSGRYFWRIGSGPDSYIEVGPTIKTALPTKYLADTEKYAGQAQLVKLPDATYNIKNYMAGIPFPHPSGPDIGGQLLYNYYYTYIPNIYQGSYIEALVDSNLSVSHLGTQQLFFKLAHVSDYDEPITNPAGNGLYLSINNQIFSPEQSRYTTSLAIYPDDPNKLPELYVFLPSLRRSLRLSSAARCAPLSGSDWTNDDQRGGFSGINNWFVPRYLGEKKLLFLVHSTWLTNANDKDPYIGTYTLTDRAIGWPRPEQNRFEMRDVYLIDLIPNPSIANSYCYSHRVLYLDKDLAYTADQGDTYDRNGKLWKLQIIGRGPTPRIPSTLNGEKSFVLPSGGELGINYDIEGNHTSLARVGDPPAIGSVVPKAVNDIPLYAMPSGLDQVMR